MRARDLMIKYLNRRRVVDEGQPDYFELVEQVAEASEQLASTLHLTDAGELSFPTEEHEKHFYNTFPEQRPEIDEAIEAKEADLAIQPRVKAAWDKLAARGIGAAVMERIEENLPYREDDPEAFVTALEQKVHEYVSGCQAIEAAQKAAQASTTPDASADPNAQKVHLADDGGAHANEPTTIMTPDPAVAPVKATKATKKGKAGGQ